MKKFSKFVQIALLLLLVISLILPSGLAHHSPSIVNRDPTLKITDASGQKTIVGDVVVKEEDTIYLLGTGRDEDHDTLQYSLQYCQKILCNFMGGWSNVYPLGVESIRGNGLGDAVFSWKTMKGQEGKHYFKLIASDGNGGFAEEYFTIVVKRWNEKPTVIKNQEFKFTEGKKSVYKISSLDNDGDAIQIYNFDFKNNLPGLIANPIDGNIEWEPRHDFVQHNRFTMGIPTKEVSFKVSVYDGKEWSDLEEVVLKVEDFNRKPLFNMFNPPQKLTIEAGKTLKYSVSGTDSDFGDVFYFDVRTSAPNGALLPGMSFNNNGDFEWKTSIKDSGLKGTVTFFIKDQLGLFGDPYSVDIEVTKPVIINTKPNVNVNSPWVFKEGIQKSFTISATDIDNDPLTYEIDYNGNSFSGSNFDQKTGTLEWNPKISYIQHPQTKKSFKIEVRAFDGKEYSDWKSINVEVEDTNQAPTIQNIGNKQYTEGDLIMIPLKVIDADVEDYGSHIFGSSGLPHGSNFDKINGIFSWQTKKGDAGVYGGITFEVSDSSNAQGAEVISITVNPSNKKSNNKPVMTKLPVQVFTEGTQGKISFPATDKDGDSIVAFEMMGYVPNGAIFDYKTGTLTWNPGFDTVKPPKTSEQFEVFVQAYDGKEWSDAQKYILGVNDKGSVSSNNNNPLFIKANDEVVEVGKTLNFVIVATDKDLDLMNINSGFVPQGLILNSISSIPGRLEYHFEWTPKKQDIGTHKIDLEVVDGKGGRDTKDITITVIDSTSVNQNSYQNIKFVKAQVAPEVAFPGEVVRVNVGLKNNGKVDLSDVRITATIIDLGLRASSSEFDFDSGESNSEMLYLQLPEFMAPGEYMIKLTARNDQFHDSTYRVVSVE